MTLRAQIERLLDAQELRITLELHREMRALRLELAELRAQIRTSGIPGSDEGA